MAGIGYNGGTSDWRNRVRLNKEEKDSTKSIQEVKMSEATMAAAELLREEQEKEEQKEEYKLAKDKQYEKLMEFVNVLVNGDAISQLFINHDLTDKAKEELVKLQEDTTAKNISKAKQELEELKKTIEDLNKESEKLSEMVHDKEEELDALTKLVDTLEKKRMLLVQFINNNLSTIVDVMREPVEEVEEDYEWRWLPTDWKGIYNFIEDLPLTSFDSYLERKIKDYSKYNDCSYEDAKRQFYELSPQIEYVSNYLKEHASKLSEYTSFYDWFCNGANNNIVNKIKSIYVPTYEIVKVKVKKHK